jgi:hypothetical protein
MTIYSYACVAIDGQTLACQDAQLHCRRQGLEREGVGCED